MTRRSISSPALLRDRRCARCELSVSCSHVCLMGEGPVGARFAFVGEAPGENEDLEGRPFIGEAGRLLDKILDQMGLDRAECYIGNAVKCRPPGNAEPGIKQIRECAGTYLWRELEIVEPEAILLLGTVALRAWLDSTTGATIRTHAYHNLRAEAQHVRSAKWVYVSYHPAAILRNNTWLTPALDQWSHFIEQVQGRKISKARYVFFKDDRKFDEEILTTIPERKRMVCDLETTSLQWHDPEAGILYASVTGQKNAGLVIPKQNLDVLVPLLSDPEIWKVNHNWKYDLNWLRSRGFRVEGPFFCTQVAAHLLDESVPMPRLEDISVKELGEEHYKAGGFNPEWSKEEIVQYGGKDADYPYRIASRQRRALRREGLWDLFKLRMDVLDVLSRMELAGVTIDKKVLKTLEDKYAAKIVKINRWVTRRYGPVNLGSNKQVSELLYKDIGIPMEHRTPKGQGKTDEKTIEEMKASIPVKHVKVLTAIQAYRAHTKLLGSFIKKLPGHVAASKRIHPNYSLVSSVSRMSCKDPNLQQIPKKKHAVVRSAFRSRWKKGLLLTADYAQAELRMLAHMADEPDMKQAFKDGLDIHKFTATKVYNVDWDEVTELQRYISKTINFLTVYGGGPKKLAAEAAEGGAHKLSMKEAQTIIDDWFAAYPAVKEWQKTVENTLIHEGFVTDLFGQKRRIVILDKQDWRLMGHALRQAVNFPIQCSVYNLVNVALVHVDREMQKRNMKSRLIMQVHDEIIADVHPKEVDELANLVYDCMVDMGEVRRRFGIQLDVEFKADVSVGPNWYEQVSYFEEG